MVGRVQPPTVREGSRGGIYLLLRRMNGSNVPPVLGCWTVNSMVKARSAASSLRSSTAYSLQSQNQGEHIALNSRAFSAQFGHDCEADRPTCVQYPNFYLSEAKIKFGTPMYSALI
eukprot:Selendium_serpulae@DN9220_c0_g1_i1.p2